MLIVELTGIVVVLNSAIKYSIILSCLFNQIIHLINSSNNELPRSTSCKALRNRTCKAKYLPPYISHSIIGQADRYACTWRVPGHCHLGLLMCLVWRRTLHGD